MAHYGFGVAAGALFGVGYRRLHLPLPGPLQGAAFGIAVWASSYAGWVPGLGILPAPPRDEERRPPAMVAAHLVYGTVLGAVLGRRGEHPARTG